MVNHDRLESVTGYTMHAAGAHLRTAGHSAVVCVEEKKSARLSLPLSFGGETQCSELSTN
jgi:hypothetical protein